MEKLSQTELLQEGFLDSVRRAGGLARAVVKGVAKGIYKMDPSGFDTIAAPFKTVASPVVGAYQQMKLDDPVMFLKQELSANRNIELVKVASQKTQNANIPIPGKKISNAANRANTGIKNIIGISKTVTIINFWGTTYRSGTERQYKTYGEANELSIPGNNQLAQRRNELITTNTQLGPRKRPREMRPARGRVIEPQRLTNSTNQQLIPYEPRPGKEPTTEQPPVPGAKLMAAEVFRTSKGLVLGDVYDPKTGNVVSSYTPKPKQTFTDLIQSYQTKGTPITVALVSTIITRSLGVSEKQNAKKIFGGAVDMDDAIMKLTNKTVVTDILAQPDIDIINTALKTRGFTEKVKVSQKVLLEQLKNL